MNSKEAFDALCKKATYSQSEIDAINEKRLIDSWENAIIYAPYIPMVVYGHGPVVRPENSE